MTGFITYPEWLHPEVFHGINFPSFLSILGQIRWYSVMYIVGLTIFYVLARYIMKKDQIKSVTVKNLDDIFFMGIIGMLLGGRIFYCLVYNFDAFADKPWEIIIPYDFSARQFVGFAGMSYHGAVIGIFTVIVAYILINKINLPEFSDLIFTAAPLGYTFGRIGNFINHELYGRITSAPTGVIFPVSKEDYLPLNLPDVQRVLSELGWKINELTLTVTSKTGEIIDNVMGKTFIGNTAVDAINLPRHPSQLYESFFEGIFLFLIMWFVCRRFKFFKGLMGAVYIIGYGVVRFFIEFLRQPDYQFTNYESGKFVGTVAGGLSMGQILCLIMIAAGAAYGIYIKYIYKLPQNAALNKNRSK